MLFGQRVQIKDTYGQRQLANIPPGIDKDENDISSNVYIDADKIRFRNGYPETIGGWVSNTFENQQTLSGVARTIYSYIDQSGIEHILIGTNSNLYSFEQGGLFNITPLVTGTTAIANSLSTNYATLGTNNPVSVTNTSRTVTLTFTPFTQGIFQIGDIISVSGVTGTIGGIAAATINATQSITAVTGATISFVVSTTATSTATGGGNAVIIATRVITVAQTAHGFSNGNRIKILAATGFGGFTAGDLNIENVIRNVSTNAYSYYLNQTTNFATSSVSSGGGAATTVQGQIAAGNATFSLGNGYGGGPYSAGPYDVAKLFTGGYILPRIWSIDRFGNGVILTPGDQGALYSWTGSINTAPTIVTNSPAAINYCFVANNQAVTFGAGGVANQIETSDTANLTVWAPDATNSAFQTPILGAARLIGHSYVQGQYLLFTQSSVFTMTFVGKPEIWIIQEVMTADGLLSPRSVIRVPGAVVWVGKKSWYTYNGSVATELPSNTLKRWFYQNINPGKYYLAFLRSVIDFDEFWVCFPSLAANEPDTYIIASYSEGHFTNGSFANTGTPSRTASEEPANPTRPQIMTSGSADGSIASITYRHEVGYSDDLNNLTGSLTQNSAQIGAGDYIQQITRIEPSSTILPLGSTNTGQNLYTITILSKNYDGQQFPISNGPYNVSGFTDKIDTRIVGRQRQYVYNFSGMQGFRIQKMFEEIKPTTVR